MIAPSSHLDDALAEIAQLRGKVRVLEEQVTSVTKERDDALYLLGCRVAEVAALRSSAERDADEMRRMREEIARLKGEAPCEC